jgi:hypothetical protein
MPTAPPVSAADHSIGSPPTSSPAARPEQRPIRFFPPEPASLDEAKLSGAAVEGLLLKLLLVRGVMTGRSAAELLKLPRKIVSGSLEQLRSDLLIAIKGSSGLEDYLFQLTEAGDDRARRLTRSCAYADAAPVCLEDYIAAVEKQSLAGSRLTLPTLRGALGDLQLGDDLLCQLGQAVNDGKGLFLYGPPGNGKTSISERVVGAFGEYIWIPYTISVDGELIRLYDPRSHRAVDLDQFKEVPHDRRWVLIQRPTIVVGGELSMRQLDLPGDAISGVSEAPVQMRANGGSLVIDDFGRQRMAPAEVLNRLIVPMEKHLDYLNLPSGRQVGMPFDTLLVLSTNLEPSDLIDEAFLRRIPYKIEVHSPSEEEFCRLFLQLAQEQGCACGSAEAEHLLAKHYRPTGRPLRFCHPRDLLRQIRNYCEFLEQDFAANETTLAAAVRNYFAGL